MNKKKGNFFVRIWNALNFFRRLTFNIIFLTIIIGGIVIFFTRGVDVPDSCVLSIKLSGTVVEELSLPMPSLPFAKSSFNSKTDEILLKDLIDSFKYAKDDKRIKAIFLDIKQDFRAGPAVLQDLKDAISKFKQSGKKIIAYSDSYSQGGYYIAAQAGEVFMHPMGMLSIKGYEVYGTFFKKALDMLEVDMNIVRAGKYKSYVESFLRDNMSQEVKEVNRKWLSVLWDVYIKDTAQARQLKENDLRAYFYSFLNSVKEVSGDMCRLAVEKGLVDKAYERDQVASMLADITGKDRQTDSFFSIDYANYLDSLDNDRFGEKAGKDTIAVIFASGVILDGNQPPGSIGGDSVSKLIRDARKDKNVKAIVLRIDSGGGSAFASELIRRELQLTREQGKKVVISMGAVAASGGYWISMASDEIWARESTITGSIGVFGMFPTFQRLLKNRLGINIDGVGTTKLAGAFNPGIQMKPELKEAMREAVKYIYNEFITKAAESRGMSKAEINKIAQGLVWSGAGAKEAGLVDKLGGLEDAIESAAALAEIKGKYDVKYIRRMPELKSIILSELFSYIYGKNSLISLSSFYDLNFLDDITYDILKLNDPNRVYAYFPCKIL